MVPCPPKQLVIFSLPFAALVAFFWFRRRKNLSRSDPGGNLEQKRLFDKPASLNKPDDAVVNKVDGNCITTVEVDVNQQSIVEDISLKSNKTITYTPSKANQEVGPVEEIEGKLIKGTINAVSVTNAAIVSNVIIDEKHTIENEESIKGIYEVGNVGFDFECQPEFEEVEKILTTPDFELNEVFHSTVIEDKDSIKLDQFNSSEEAWIDNGKEDYIRHQTELEDNISVEEEDLTQSDIQLDNNQFSLHEQETLKKVELKSFHIAEQVDNISFVNEKPILDQNNPELLKNHPASTSGENLTNVSADTGLGSQDISAIDFQPIMAHGHETEKSENDASGLEQKLASLGLDSQQAATVKRAERDSANHSPAEVMLNSPAISTFSDVHSEGSSDSGKGCSDVVTPPSRTPAGGSSVAGDQVPSIYEFVMPQVIVGRLIGRHGMFLHDIRAKTHTNVFIKRHPETSSLKICAIEGTQADIEAAVKMIRQRFPLRRFPDLSLERVSFVNNSCVPINPENMQLHLVEGVNNDVVVSYVINAGQLVLQQPFHITYNSLYRMTCFMNNVYNSNESPPLLDPQPDVVCVAPGSGGWYRAQITSVDKESNTSEVRFLDYGGLLTIDNSLLRQIRGDFMLLPFQAIECVMANIVPAGGSEEWSDAATQLVQSITTQQILQAQVYGYTDTGIPLVYLYFTQFYQSSTDPSGIVSRALLLNQQLVTLGHADLIEGVVALEDGETTA